MPFRNASNSRVFGLGRGLFPSIKYLWPSRIDASLARVFPLVKHQHPDDPPTHCLRVLRVKWDRMKRVNARETSVEKMTTK